MDPIEEAVIQLKELNVTAKKLLEISGLQFALDPIRYISRKLRTGEAIESIGAWYQSIGAGGTFTITFANPVGYIWIGISELTEVSQNGVMEVTRFIDDETLPSSWIPRLVSIHFTWAETLPFVFIIKESAQVIIINHDIAPQWIVGAFYGIYLRKEVWERDSRLMDEAAERYLQPPPPMPL